MKKPTVITVKPAPKENKIQPVAAVITKEATPTKVTPAKKAPTKTKSAVVAPAPKVKDIQPAATKAAAPKKTAPAKKVPTKIQAAAVVAEPVSAKPNLTMAERIGLTSGSIWHYLTENGATSVATLVKALIEEEKIVQRSIGWLAQEGKITLETVGRVETIALKK